MNFWILGILVFFARIIDVSAGTFRTISIVHGRTKIAFFLAIIETSVWLIVLSQVLPQVVEKPLLGVFYAFGFATGNVVGILVEKRLAMGHINFRIITKDNAPQITESLREKGFIVTTFEGEGKTGKVTEVYVATERKALPGLIKLVKEIEPDAFYITEQTGTVSKLTRPTMVPSTGWRSIPKKK